MPPHLCEQAFRACWAVVNILVKNMEFYLHNRYKSKTVDCRALPRQWFQKNHETGREEEKGEDEQGEEFWTGAGVSFTSINNSVGVVSECLRDGAVNCVVIMKRPDCEQYERNSK